MNFGLISDAALNVYSRNCSAAKPKGEIYPCLSAKPSSISVCGQPAVGHRQMRPAVENPLTNKKECAAGHRLPPIPLSEALSAVVLFLKYPCCHSQLKSQPADSQIYD
jgi:hypothetical protein